MKGLIKNNLYTALPNVKVFFATMILLGVFVIVTGAGSPALITCLLSVNKPKEEIISEFSDFVGKAHEPGSVCKV